MNAVDATKERYEHIRIFGKDALFTNNRIDRETVPAEMFCYDIRGTDNDPGELDTLEKHVIVNHSGTIVIAEPLDFYGGEYISVIDKIGFYGGDELSLDEFRQKLRAAEPVLDENSRNDGNAPIKYGVVDAYLSEQEFESKIKELIPGASATAIQKNIQYANELEADDIHPKGAFFSESFVAYFIASRRYGADIARELLKICEDSCLNPWEILDAAELMRDGTSPDKIADMSVNGELDMSSENWNEIKAWISVFKRNEWKIPVQSNTPYPVQLDNTEATPNTENNVATEPDMEI